MSAPMSVGVITRYLRAVPLFSGLSEAQLQPLASAARCVTFRKGARIFEEGAPADCCYVLITGRGKVVLNSEDGSEVLLAGVGPGDLVGEVALLDGATRSAAFVAVEPCQCLVIPARVFDALRSDASFERKLVSRVISTLRDSTEHVRRVASGPSVARVAWCLARIARREGRLEGKTVIISRTPHHELAAMAGCTRETVSRALASLKRRKFVTWNATTMTLDIEGLQRVIRTELTVGDRGAGSLSREASGF